MGWKLRLSGGREVSFSRMEMMGIVNVTPDSFFSGSRTEGEEEAFEKATKHIEEGARFIDIGGESTRPGSAPVTEEEEIARICPVIERVRKACPEVIISADTYRAETAREALRAGADMINDISGLTFEPELAGPVADAGAALVLMHTGGRPETMQEDPRYDDVVEEVYDFLDRQIAFAQEWGIGRDQIMTDVGIGFGKTKEHNLELLRHLDLFQKLGCPHLLAVSRKTVIGKVIGEDREETPGPEERLSGTLAITAFAARLGIACARVHDVRENLDAARMGEALRDEDGRM